MIKEYVAAQIGACIMLLNAAIAVAAAPVPIAVDPAEQHALSIWDDNQRLGAIIYVHAQIPTNDALADAYGTGFMISDEYAVTAGHVICQVNPPHRKADVIQLFIGGPGGVDTRPLTASCYPSGIDVAILRVPSLAAGRTHLTLGALDILKADPFVTTYGYGDNPQGRQLKGNTQLAGHGQISYDPSNMVRTNLGSAPGDSGAPILNREGNVVGVLYGGKDNGVTAFIPFIQIEASLTAIDLSLPPPPPMDLQASSPPVPHHDMAIPPLTGTVTVQLGRSSDGNWPVPASRSANAGEVQVLVYYGKDFGNPIGVTTNGDGSWAVSAPDNLPADGLQFSIIASITNEVDLPIDQRSYRANPLSGFLSPNNIGDSRKITIFARSAYVRSEYIRAIAAQQLIGNTRGSANCEPENDPASQPHCSKDQIDQMQATFSAADDAFHRAYNASSAAPSDIAITTQIGFAWANFRISIGRACQAAQILNDLTGIFTNNALSGQLVYTIIDTTVRCQNLPDSAGTIMAWRAPDETRQQASIRFIDETLHRFASNPKAVGPSASGIISNVVVALESYQQGTAQISLADAAAIISKDDELNGFLTEFSETYVRAWCSSLIAKPGKSPSSIQTYLRRLRSLAPSCGR